MIKKSLLTDAEARRKEDIINVQALLNSGYTPSYIRDLTGHTYRTIRKFKDGDPDILCRNLANGKKKSSKLDIFADTIVFHMSKGVMLKEIFEMIEKQGHKGKLTNFYDYCRRLLDKHDIEYYTRQNTVGAPINREKLNLRYVHRRDIIDFLWANKEIGDSDWSYVLEKYPCLNELRLCIQEFRTVFENKNTTSLDSYIEKYSSSTISKISTFAKGLLKDIDAVRQAVSSPLSNGFVEGNNSRLKMIKRMMYGRASLELLRAKIMLQGI